VKFFPGSGAGFIVEPSQRSTLRYHKRFGSLAILFAILILAQGCGLIGGSEAAEEETEEEFVSSHEPIDSENIREAAAAREEEADDPDAEGDSQPEATAEPEPEPTATTEPVAAETETETEAEVAAEPAEGAGVGGEPAAAANPVLVQDAELARDLAWVHVSRCVTLNSIELAATLINADWFVASSVDAIRAYGFWKVDAVTGEVTPHDTLSRLWQAAIDSQCSPGSLEALAGPPEPPAPVIADAPQAVAAVWSFLSRCYPNLKKEIFEATEDPARGEWVVVTKTDSGQEFGTWKVTGKTGELNPYAGLAQSWDSTVKSECSAEAMAALITPTPVPTQAPAVKDFNEAITNLWAHLVKCAPAMTVDDWDATWNPVNREWVVVTKPAVTVDYGVWIVAEDGSIIPENREAVRRNMEANLAAC